MNGLWQLSETPIDVIPDPQYGKMRISMIDANNGVITVDNKDEEINSRRRQKKRLLDASAQRSILPTTCL